ncbi:hypothetical protein OF83DRAFT_1069461 [Amylostereum chailletii]|nr:hypothetical protein OF83DRAFT_1069461 [Amylostereum chailletii]
MSENSVIISTVLTVAHTDMFEAGRQVLLKLAECPGHEVLAAQFSFITPVISVITNRETPAHRNTQSSHFPWFDCLATFGGDADTTLGLPTFGMVFQYLSGSMSLFCGSSTLHMVSATKKNRVCIAGYMRRNVLCCISVVFPGWSSLSQLLPEGYCSWYGER